MRICRFEVDGAKAQVQADARSSSRDGEVSAGVGVAEAGAEAMSSTIGTGLQAGHAEPSRVHADRLLRVTAETAMDNTWIDHLGREWPLVRSARRLKFSYPTHAALRAFVFHRDGFCCVRCGASAASIPADFDGRDTLRTNTRTGAGTVDLLVVDHILTLSAGGKSHPSNLQTLCETCNKKKMPEDMAAAAAFKARV